MENNKSTNLYEDVTQTLHLIYGEITGTKCSNEPCSSSKSSSNCKWKWQKSDDKIFAGRFVTSMSLSAPFRITKRFVKPKVARTLNSRSVVEQIVRELTGNLDLSNIVLFITPMSMPDHPKCHKLHSYCLDKQHHLGTTTLTTEELELIERYHRTDNYAIVYCTHHIELADAAGNTPIRDLVFETIRRQSQAAGQTCYQGQVVSLSCRCGKLVSRKDKVDDASEQAQRNIIQPKRRDVPQQSRSFNRSSSGSRCGTLKAAAIRNTSVVQLNVNTELPGRKLRLQDTCETKARPSKSDLQKQTATKVLQREAHKGENALDVGMSQPDNNGVQMLREPTQLRDSVGHIPLPLMIPSTTSLESIVDKSSTTFARLMGPALVPANYSHGACLQLERKLRNPNVRQAFSKFGRLVGLINGQTCPRPEHLLVFFQFAEILDFKMFVRREYSFLGCPATTEPRYRIECYVFDDRRDYIASIALLCRQLHNFAKLCPGASCNFRFHDNAFQLTHIPAVLTGWLKSALYAIHARPLYDLLGELTYAWVLPPPTLLALTSDGESPNDQGPNSKNVEPYLY